MKAYTTKRAIVNVEQTVGYVNPSSSAKVVCPSLLTKSVLHYVNLVTDETGNIDDVGRMILPQEHFIMHGVPVFSRAENDPLGKFNFFSSAALDKLRPATCRRLAGNGTLEFRSR